MPKQLWGRTQLRVDADPLSEAQEALRKLRTDPDDKQAAQAVERALQWLRERDVKRRPLGESKPK
jgi:hypothetical protein